MFRHSWSRLSIGLIGLSLTLTAIPGAATVAASQGAVERVPVTGTIPAPIAGGRAPRLSAVAPSMPLSLSVSLAMRNSGLLHRFITTQAAQGRYMSAAQFKRFFGATSAQERRFRAWAAQHHLSVTYASPDGLVFGLQGTEAELHRHCRRGSSGTRMVHDGSSLLRPIR